MTMAMRSQTLIFNAQIIVILVGMHTFQLSAFGTTIILWRRSREHAAQASVEVLATMAWTCGGTDLPSTTRILKQ